MLLISAYEYLVGTGGAAGAAYVGSTGWSVVGGVVGHSGSKAFTISGCTNKAETMDVDMHMLKANGSSGAFGGIVGVSYAKLSDCQNHAKIDFSSRFKTMYVGGVAGYYEINAVTQALCNYGDLTFDAGENIPADNTSQSCNLRVGGILGYTTGNVDNKATGFQPWINEGNLTIKGGNATTAKNYGGIIGYVEATNTTMAIRGDDKVSTPSYWNKGAIKVEKSIATTYVGGIHGNLNFTSAKGNDAVAMNKSLNDGDITVDVAKAVAVGGIVGTYNYGCVYNSVNTGKITVNSSKGDLWVGGNVGNASSGRRMVGMNNEGDIEVTTTDAESTVCVGGIRGFINGQMNSSNINSGNVAVTTNAKTAYVGGIGSRDGATKVYAGNTGNVTYTYTGAASTDVKAYVALGIANRNGSTAEVSGTYSGTLTLNNTAGITTYYGLLHGYVTSKCGAASKTVNIKKGTTINGVTVSDVETDPGYYKSMAYLFGASTPADAVLTSTINLVD